MIYLAWIALCAFAFIALRGAEDPSRRSGRILSVDAARTAVLLLRRTDPSAYRDFQPVHVAYARAGEGGSENRWIVLCDTVPHSALRRAVVVELRSADGSLIAIRKPVN